MFYLYVITIYREDESGKYVIKPEGKGQEGRPYFGPTQIRNLSEVYPGVLAILNGIDSETNRPYNEESNKIKIVGLPVRDDEGLWSIEVEFTTPANLKAGVSLTDHSVMSYPSGAWNQTNWLEDPSKEEKPA